MATQTGQVWLITGSSTGFGRSLAEAVLQTGDRITQIHTQLSARCERLTSRKLELAPPERLKAFL
jgi:NAD(P)-dependent dehydrogenase (short-subunit alcohol dehydrogenase family)